MSDQNYGGQPGYPPNQPGYPPIQPGFPQNQPGYPPGQPGIPQSQPVYPQSQPGYPPGQPGIPQSQPVYPLSQPGYPPNQPQPSYTPSQPGYPQSQPGYPPSQPGYPQSQPGYPPSQPGYPQSQPGYPPSQPGYPPSQPGYPPSQPGYPTNPDPPNHDEHPPTEPTTEGSEVSSEGSEDSNEGSEDSSEGSEDSSEGSSKTTEGSSHAAQQVKGRPSVVPLEEESFDPRDDAEILRKAMKGFGTDEKAIIKCLTQRSNDQRQRIAREYKTFYGKNLIVDLKKELSGKLEDLVIAMMTPHYTFLAKELHHAMAGIGTTESTIIEILATGTNEDIENIKEAYAEEYKKSLEDDLISETSGSFKRLLVSLLQANRNEDPEVYEDEALEDAKKLYDAGKGKFGTDESTFNAILCERSYPQLGEVIFQYKEYTGHELEKAIEDEFSGDIKKALIALVKSVLNKPAFFAEKLRASTKGLGTDDRSLIRLVVSRNEIDMLDIKDVYEEMFEKPLESHIESDCSGDYKKCLLALIEEPDED